MNAHEFACAHFEKLRAERSRLDQGPFGLSRAFSLKQRVALAAWLCEQRAALEDLTPELDAIISGQFMIPGDVIANVVRDEARRMRKAWEEHKATLAGNIESV